MTSASGGVAVAIFHTRLQQPAGVVVAPALIFFYLGSDAAAAAAAASHLEAGREREQAGVRRAAPRAGGDDDPRSDVRRGVATPVKARLKLASGNHPDLVYNTFCNTFQSGFRVSGERSPR